MEMMWGGGSGGVDYSEMIGGGVGDRGVLTT